MKSKLFRIITLTLFCIPLYSNVAVNSSRPKVGVVLSGGGAKGMAHIATLKMLDSLDIPVDYIVGTSMGGIIAGLYSIGYSGREIERLADTMPWVELFSDKPPRRYLSYLEKLDDGLFQLRLDLKDYTPVAPSGMIQGQKISLQFSELTIFAEYIKDFDNFPIPFRCVAADLVTGNEVVLHKGSISKAMRATMSIPTIFAPVAWGDSLLVDGGTINNLPVDVAIDMGADYIIGIDVGDFKADRAELTSMLNVLEQTFNMPLYSRIVENQKKCNILIKPELEGYSTADFEENKIRDIIRIGHDAVFKKLPQLIEEKERYQLHRGDGTATLLEFSEPIIHGISITGNTSLSFQALYNMIDLQPGDIFENDAFNERLAEIRTMKNIDDINYQVMPQQEGRIRLVINVQERNRPLIHSVFIDGNENLPFSFIYNFLNIKPLDRLDLGLLEKRINELYALGYFDLITYEIEPAKDQTIKLYIHIKEKSQNSLFIGLHYDDYYKLVGSVKLRSTNFLIPGLQIDALAQFSGLKNFDLAVFYPSRSWNLPLFPLVRAAFKELPIPIYENTGKKIASYWDRSFSVGFGIAMQIQRLAAAEIQYNSEFMDVKPNIALPDPEQFPSWKDQLRKIQATFYIDHFDDPILPREGVYLHATYEHALKELQSEIVYNTMKLDLQLISTWMQFHTTKLSGYYFRGTSSTPTYKLDYVGGPDTFIGVDYYQLYGNNFAFGRFDYRYEHASDIFLKLSVNLARNWTVYEGQTPEINVNKWLFGYGIGIKFITILGPFEVTYARGPQGVYNNTKERGIFYMQAGFNLN